MGLSNEERMSKFLWCMQSWRKKVVELQAAISRQKDRDEARAVVAKWVETIDHLTGQFVRGANQNSAYWILGENADSFHGLMADPYDIRADAEPSGYASMPEGEYETVQWWQNNADFDFVASRLVFSPYKSHEGLEQLAKWWDQQMYISAVIYPVWRYQDDLFPSGIKQAFETLVGEMVNRRFEVCFSEYGVAEKEQHRMETYLLLKSKAFHLLLRDETKNLKGKDYFNKKFDGYALLAKVAAMSAKDLKDLFEAEDKRKWDWDRKYHADEEAKKVEKVSGLFGPPVKAPDEENDSKEPARKRRPRKS